jgi:citrate lyase beta subunit
MWQAVLALGVALIGFLGVALGAVVTGFVTLRQTSMAAQRERESQQMLRWQERKDAHDAFQRDTILALQDAIAELWTRAMGMQLDSVRRRSSVKDPEFRALVWRINMLRARIFDDDLRAIVRALMNEVMAAASATDIDVLEARTVVANRLNRQLYERMNTLLKAMF